MSGPSLRLALAVALAAVDRSQEARRKGVNDEDVPMPPADLFLNEAAEIVEHLPTDWCGHIGVEEAIAQGQSRIAYLDARIVDLNGEVLTLMTEIASLRDTIREQESEIAWRDESLAFNRAALRAALEER